MKVLFIGGTGNISMACSELALNKGVDLYLLCRGNTASIPQGAIPIYSDINNVNEVKDKLKGQNFDVVVNWIAFNVHDINRDFELFKNITRQYIFISSASCYQKPLQYPVITEKTPVINTIWDYSSHKIACEKQLQYLFKNYQFPITIVRPSHTYDTVIPVAIGGWKNYNIIDRIKKGKKVIVHGDGTSLWTLTHARDFAKGFVGLLGKDEAIGEAFHITSDETLTWNQIYDTVGMAIDCEVNKIHIASDFIGKFDDRVRCSLLGDKAVSVLFDNSKIKKLVPDFIADIKFEKGIKNTLDWFEEDDSRKVISENLEDFINKVIQAYER